VRIVVSRGDHRRIARTGSPKESRAWSSAWPTRISAGSRQEKPGRGVPLRECVSIATMKTPAARARYGPEVLPPRVLFEPVFFTRSCCGPGSRATRPLFPRRFLSVAKATLPGTPQSKETSRLVTRNLATNLVKNTGSRDKDDQEVALPDHAPPTSRYGVHE